MKEAALECINLEVEENFSPEKRGKIFDGKKLPKIRLPTTVAKILSKNVIIGSLSFMCALLIGRVARLKPQGNPRKF